MFIQKQYCLSDSHPSDLSTFSTELVGNLFEDNSDNEIEYTINPLSPDELRCDAGTFRIKVQKTNYLFVTFSTENIDLLTRMDEAIANFGDNRSLGFKSSETYAEKLISEKTADEYFQKIFGNGSSLFSHFDLDIPGAYLKVAESKKEGQRLAFCSIAERNLNVRLEKKGKAHPETGKQHESVEILIDQYITDAIPADISIKFISAEDDSEGSGQINRARIGLRSVKVDPILFKNMLLRFDNWVDSL